MEYNSRRLRRVDETGDAAAHSSALGDFHPFFAFCRADGLRDVGVTDPAKVDRAAKRIIRVWMGLDLTYAGLKLLFAEAKGRGDLCQHFCSLRHQVRAVVAEDGNVDPAEVVYLLHRHFQEVFPDR